MMVNTGLSKFLRIHYAEFKILRCPTHGDTLHAIAGQEIKCCKCSIEDDEKSGVGQFTKQMIPIANKIIQKTGTP